MTCIYFGLIFEVWIRCENISLHYWGS